MAAFADTLQAVEEHAPCETRPVRLLTLTTLFPNARQPRHGIFVANRLRRLCDTGRVAASVLAAVPWFPGAYRDRADIPQTESMLGFEVLHPRYINIPRVGMMVQPDSLARALLDELRRNDIGAERFDAVDAHYFYPDGVAAARVADALGLPLVISARGSDINLIGDIAYARRRMLRAANRAQALIAVSAALANRMAELGMPASRIRVLRNGVDAELFAPFPRVDARKRLGLPERGEIVLAVGNLVPEKGLDLLIDAISTLPNVRLLIVGEGPLRSSLASLARAHAPGRVDFRPNTSQADLRYVYAAGDVLALPSLREGWPNVVLEALACGTPVVAAPVGGVPEILQPGSPSLLVGERSAAQWGRAIRALLDARWETENVRRYALRFGWDEVIAKQCAVYEEVVAAHGVHHVRSCA